MPVINGVYLKDFTALPGAVADANIIPIAISGDNIAYRTTVSGIVTDARVTSKLLTGLSITGSAVLATDTILQAFGKVQNQLNGKQETITLTTTGSSGAATLIGSTLNIPNYAPDLSGYVTLNTAQTITAAKTFSTSGNSDTLIISHSSGSGVALTITKGGNGEGIIVNKTSGSGNAVTITGTLQATTLVKTGGTSSQFLKADGTVDSTAYGTGSVTSVAALTLGTTGTDLSSTVANGTTTPVITLNVPDASATARGVITAGTQTIAGNKTLNGLLTITSGNQNSLQLLNNSSTANTLTLVQQGSGPLVLMNNAIGTVFSISNAGALSGTSATFSSTATASAFIPSGATVPSNGMYLSATNTLDFATNSTNRLSISSAGAATFASTVTAGNTLTVGTAFKPLFQVKTISGFQAGYGIVSANDEMSGGLQLISSASNSLQITADPDNLRASSEIGFSIDGANKMTIASTGAATFSDSVTATGFFESSSIKLKNIMQTNPLTNINPDVIQYTRKTDESKDIRYGYSAEQIHSLMPELTDKDVTAVKYLDVHTLLIAQLQQEIKELKAKFN